MKFKLEEHEISKTQTLKRPLKSELSRKGYYLGGGIPLDWLEKCSRLNGKCLAVGIHIWWRFHVGGKKLPIKVQGARLAALGVSRYSLYRALDKMKRAGLIRFTSKVGASALITIDFEGGNHEAE